MRGKLRGEIKQRKPFPSLEEEAFLNLQRTSNLLLQALARFLKPYDLTPTQYNVLRILRGSHPDALPCGEVRERMVVPEPDITRLLDRLERRGLIARARDDRKDRRIVNARITREGLGLLAELDRPVTDRLKGLLGHLSEKQLQMLIQLLECAREECL